MLKIHKRKGCEIARNSPFSVKRLSFARAGGWVGGEGGGVNFGVRVCVLWGGGGRETYQIEGKVLFQTWMDFTIKKAAWTASIIKRAA